MRSLPGATIDDMYDYIKSLLKKAPDNVILHTGINEKTRSPSKIVFDELSLISFIEKT